MSILPFLRYGLLRKKIPLALLSMRITSTILLLISLLWCNAQNTTTITYTANNTNFANPERGFYRYTDTYGSNPIPLTLAELNNLRSSTQQTLIFRYIVLDDFVNAPISNAFLTAIQNDFNIVRQAGFKIVPRFCYVNQLNYDANGNILTPYGDANKARILQHIAQLKPILQQNADIILTLQNGFWGVWGENYYSDHFGCIADAPLTPQNWADRKEVTDSLLAALPNYRSVSLRTPVLKATYYGLTMPDDSISIADAYNPSNILSRLGGHNDCFLADYNDYTFDDTLSEKSYWRAETRYLPMGGETCENNTTYTNCANTLIEMQQFHWTYCNDGYHPAVLQDWTNQGCIADIKKRLGYRFELLNANFPDAAAPNAPFTFNLQLRNIGFAAPVNPRDVKLVLQNTADNSLYTLDLPNQDPRYWFANTTYTTTETINLPSNISCGTYQLYLYLPDPEPTLANNPKYAIRLANQNTWQNTTGYNDLQHSINIELNPNVVGNNAVCGNSTHTYTVAPIAGSTYTWTVTGGSTMSGQGTNSITVQWNNGTAGTVAVTQSLP